jgi:hypothetical protein
MNSIHRYIANVFTEEDDSMEVDNNFTERYLSQFSAIDQQSIDVMVDNGYQDKDSLLAFDIKEDLPLLPDLNMAQKSLLRKALKQLHDSQELESKVNDIKGVDTEELFANTSRASSQLKRKRESTTMTSSPKRSRSSDVTSDPMTGYQSPPFSDGLGTRMRQMISGRKSIRTANASDLESDIDTTLTSKRLSRSNVWRNRQNDSSEDTDDREDTKPDVKIVMNTKTLRGRAPRNSAAKPKSTPLVVSKDSPNSLSLDLSERMTRTPTARPSTTPTQPNGRNGRTDTYVPTPTEIEVRERLALKKATAKPKRGRKR